MQNRTSGLAAEIEAVRAYTAADPKLRACHHFSYDFRLGAFERAEYVVMGVNPGETDDDLRTEPGPTEESSLFDYRGGVDSQSRRRWFNACRRTLRTDRLALTELVFWSSPDVNALRARLGDLGPYLGWCRELNQRLLEHHRPRAVVLPGFSFLRETVELYGLKPVASVPDALGRRLIEHMTRDGQPWVFTKHWSGARGFTREDRERIADHLAAL
jgi:hypothetical protein